MVVTVVPPLPRLSRFPSASSSQSSASSTDAEPLQTDTALFRQKRKPSVIDLDADLLATYGRGRARRAEIRR